LKIRRSQLNESSELARRAEWGLVIWLIAIRREILVASFLLQGLAILLLLRGEGAALFWAFVILFAVGHGGALAIAPLVLNDLFGSTYLGSLVGAYWLIATAGSLVGPALASALRNGAGTYFPVLVVFAASLFCAALLAGMIQRSPMTRA